MHKKIDPLLEAQLNSACLKALREGETLIVWKLDGVARGLTHLVNLIQDLSKRGVKLGLEGLTN